MSNKAFFSLTLFVESALLALVCRKKLVNGGGLELPGL